MARETLGPYSNPSFVRLTNVSTPFPYPCSPVTTPVLVTSLSHTQRLLDLLDLFIYSTV